MKKKNDMKSLSLNSVSNTDVSRKYPFTALNTHDKWLGICQFDVNVMRHRV